MKPHRLGVVSRLYPELTASYLTEALGNIFYMDSKSNNKYKPIDSMFFEWEVEVLLVSTSINSLNCWKVLSYNKTNQQHVCDNRSVQRLGETCKLLKNLIIEKLSYL